MAAKIATARLVAAASARTGHGGTTLPGRLVLRLDGEISSRLCRRLEQGVVFVSATNGKTTTCSMMALILERDGKSIIRNREGANLASGVATALLKEARLSTAYEAQLGLFEVDEAALPEVAKNCQSRALMLMNLFRDQLDRYGELETIAERWQRMLMRMPAAMKTILNADDPLVADLAVGRGGGVVFFGIEDQGAFSPIQAAADSKFCRHCGAAYDYQGVFMGHLGHYRCPDCGHRRPRPHVLARNITSEGMQGTTFELVAGEEAVAVKLSLPGLYNVYNALAAAAACRVLDVGLETIAAGLADFSAAFGRQERLQVEGHPVVLMLVKNPTGFNEVLRTLLEEPGEKQLMLALNDAIADGRDISWIWDVDLEPAAAMVSRAVVSGTRAEEMAMRLKYAGLSPGRLEIHRDLAAALSAALSRLEPGETLYVLPTYTAMLALRRVISRQFATDGRLEDLVWS